MDSGLEKVIAAETVLSDVNGTAGRLTIRGYRVEDLAKSSSFETVVHLLWSGFYDDLPAAPALTEQIGRARSAAFARLETHFATLASLPAMEGLRLAAALCPDEDTLDTAIDLIATLAVATAGASRLRRRQAPLAPDASLGHAADFLRMLTGKTPDAGHTRGMNAYFTTVSEHGLNASTFAARVVASTQAGLTSAVIGGISALKGPLHGGAPGPVLDMLDAIGEPKNAEAWIRSALERGERLMGFGHRVYKVRDPRADALKAAASLLPRSDGRLHLADAIEQIILTKLAIEKPGRSLETNVEYYTAVLLEALGIPRDDFTCVFACARAAGWLAHAREQLATRRIVRPQSVYVGPGLSEVA